MSRGRPPSVRLEVGAAGSAIAELIFDAPDRPVNVLSMAVVDDIDAALDDLLRGSDARGLLVRSAKSGTFIAGADLTEIAAVEESSIAVGHAARVQSLFRRLEQLPFPVVAAIDGACLGGGLELALACHFRIASDSELTRLGLPEVRLGLIPGFGGTQRLPRRVGLRRALHMILKGYTLSASEAARAGLVDEVASASGFLDTVRRETLRLARRERTVRRPRLGLIDRLLEVVGPARDLYLLVAERAVSRETKGSYPAPLKAIEAVREGLRVPLEEGLEIEAGLVGALAVSPSCKSLVRLFFLTEGLKKDPGADLSQALPVRRIGVIGGGVMGSGIAGLAAASGLEVRLREVSLEALRAGLAGAASVAREAIRRRRGSAGEIERAIGRLSATLEPIGFRQAGVVIEAVVEEMALKRDVLEELAERMGPDAVFATNTSALSISELARSAHMSSRVVGMHFFNPVGRMPLVEVVRGDNSSEAAVATVVVLARALGKVPIVVADGPGFLVNRVLAPYLNEAILLVVGGVDPSAVERAMLDFGMPMGPLEVLDEVGLDVARHVSATLRAAFPERLPLSPLIDALVADGRLGRKNGLGFYRHGKRGKVLDPGLGRALRRLGVRPTRVHHNRGALQERLVLAMVNEAARALEQGIARSPGDIDLALTLGAGFPPFRGGLLGFAATLGTGAVLSSLERLETEHGERFRPAPLIVALAQKGLGFLEAGRLLG